MAPVEELKCPNCGAPIDYKKSEAATTICPYCSTTIVLPEVLLPPRPRLYRRVEPGQPSPAPMSKSCVAWLVVAILLFTFGIIFIPLYISQQIESADNVIAEDVNAPTLDTPKRPSPSPEPKITLTPAYAYPVNTFGEEGIGAGMFDDARYIAIDGDRSVYVADYEGGRVQRFDSSGNYLSQWRVGSENTIISSMTADRGGRVYVAHGGAITAFDGKSGEVLFETRDPRGGDYGGLFAADDGQLAAVWYEARWGLITSLEGHREELVFFDKNGAAVKTVPSFISGQTDSVVLDAELAVDGSGKIYVLSFGEVMVFSPSGKYLDKFSPPAESGQIASYGAMAVDGQGRLYLGGSEIYVLSPDGSLIDTIPLEGYVDSFAVDSQGHIFAVARDKVTEYAPRGE